MKAKVHASLFSGIGGPEVAATLLGWENAFHCEINPFGRRVLEYWFPNSVSYEDITKTDFSQWRGHIDVLTGGFPCQPFSYAGKRGGREDERYLWPQMLRAIDEIRPTWVVGENVAGITTMVEGGVLADLGCSPALFAEGDGLHRYELDQPFTIERICRDLEHAGYSVQPLLIPAAGVGAPHRRDRIFIIARNDESATDSAGRGEGAPGAGKGVEGGRCHKDKLTGERGTKAERNNRPSNVLRPSPDTDRRGRREILQQVQPGLPNGEKPFRDGWERDVTDTSGEWEYDREMLPGNRWADFPTVPPIYRGNDGLPFDVDRLSISPARWRTETLKAYGNAIVPQVMYRIFQAIDSI